ncbi:MAG: Unknown protein [uncultured Thiotrichaceae bacterium]|uniref:Uncharacterized protein n=1 Tax=uncultured Thiotrichaceae bacterium TaxID=298394 RepID=A0A6S6T2W6_9GAMM|nr:MAG: Unknown protein [uncultured Thiotrichaceae bacterium]
MGLDSYLLSMRKMQNIQYRKRNQKKYGNPDGPSFSYLVKKAQSKGNKGDNAFKAIIQSSSRTNPMYNQQCEK